MIRKWRTAPQVWPSPNQMHLPQAQAKLLEFLAGMGALEMVIWERNGGQIPPSLAKQFRAASMQSKWESAHTVVIPWKNRVFSTRERRIAGGVGVASANAG